MKVYLYALDNALQRIKDLSKPNCLAQIRQLTEKNNTNKKKKLKRITYKRNKDGERSFPFSGKRSAPKSKRPKKLQTGNIIFII